MCYKYVLKILSKKEKEERNLDKEKFEKFKQILNPESFPLLLDDLSKNYFNSYIRDIFNEYKNYLINPENFFGIRLRKKFNKFNSSFEKLDIFLSKNFYYKRDGVYEINKYDDDFDGRESVINDLINIKNRVKKDYVDLIDFSYKKHLSIFQIIIIVVFSLFFIIKSGIEIFLSLKL